MGYQIQHVVLKVHVPVLNFSWIDNTIHWEPYWNITLYVWMIRICRVLSYITTFLGQLIISLVIGTYICHSLLLYDGFLIIQWSFMPIKARYRIDTYITIEYSITKQVSERSYQFVLWNIGQHFSVTLYHFQYIYFKN